MKEYKTLFVDTNVFLRLIVKEDPKTVKECTQFFKYIQDKRIHIATSSLVLAEIVWVLTSYYKVKKEVVVEALQSILAIPTLEIIDSHDLLQATRLYSSHSVKFIDAMITSIPAIAKKQWPVVTYDTDFRALDVVHGMPSAVLS